VVAGASADKTLTELVLREAAHHVVSASQFVGAYDLEVLPFEEDPAVVFAGQALVKTQGSAVDDLGKPLRGRMKV
jgi:hypothetical protein